MTASASRTATFLLRQPRQVQGFREQLGTLRPGGADQQPGDGNAGYSDPGYVDAGYVEPPAAADPAAQHQPPALTLLWIPPGRFWMGSPDSEPERRESEGLQHLVQLQGFFIGQTTITQAQWREVAQWQERPGESWGRELDPEPSFFQLHRNPKARSFRGASFALLEGETDSDQRPVDNVSWLDAVEFCSRLSQRTGRHYTLPSEAQWEYACRAGSSTPFHFGETITPDLANYHGNYSYADGPKGAFRKQTIPVGMFPANAWGLHDMHGNVLEWCLDHWHAGYEGAPADGSAWVDSEDEKSDTSRLLRGGSWGLPRTCRSAYRGHGLPGLASYTVGFRVVCLPQDPSLNP